jgi:hypothetical protein
MVDNKIIIIIFFIITIDGGFLGRRKLGSFLFKGIRSVGRLRGFITVGGISS